MADASSNSFLTGLPSKGSVDLGDVNPVFASRMQNLISAAQEATGGTVTVTSGYRSPEKQAQIYANYTQSPVSYGGNTYTPDGTSGIAARPGASQHQLGLAIDISPTGAAYKWMVARAPEYGVESGTTWSGSQYDPPHFQLPRSDNKIALSGAVPPMNIPDVGSAYADSTEPVSPASLSPALAAIQNVTNPDGSTDWNSFYNGIAPGSGTSLDNSSAFPQITTPQQASDFYQGMGLAPADSGQSAGTPITDQASADAFYNGFGLSPQPLTPHESTPIDAGTSLAMNPVQSSFAPSLSTDGSYTGPAFDAGLTTDGQVAPYATPNSAANFAPPQSPPLAPSNWDDAYLSAPSVAGGSQTSPVYGSNVFQGSNSNAGGSSPTSWPDSYYSAPDITTPSYQDTTGGIAGTVQLPGDVTPSGALSAMNQATSADNYTDWYSPYSDASNTGSSSMAMNSPAYDNGQNAADISSLGIAPSITAPKYIDIEQRTPIPASQPIEQGSAGVSFDPNSGIAGNYSLGDTYDSTPTVAAPSYSATTVKQLNPDYAKQAAALAAYNAKLAAYTTPPPAVAAPSALSSWYNGTPLGHITGLLSGNKPTGGLLGMLAGLTSPTASTALSPAAQLAANPSLAAQQNAAALAAIKNNQTSYSLGAGYGNVPTVTVNGTVRQSYGDAANGVGRSLV